MLLLRFILPLLLPGQVLLEKHAALLEAAQETGRERVVTPFQAAKGLIFCLAMAVSALYALFAAVDEELAYHLGTDRVALIAAQVRTFLPSVLFLLLLSLLFLSFLAGCLRIVWVGLGLLQSVSYQDVVQSQPSRNELLWGEVSKLMTFSTPQVFMELGNFVGWLANGAASDSPVETNQLLMFVGSKCLFTPDQIGLVANTSSVVLGVDYAMCSVFFLLLCWW